MSDDAEGQCVHIWGDPEEVELGLGTLFSPLCKLCGAVKLQEQNRAYERQQLELAMLPINRPVATNIPPAGAPVVHGFQHEIFTDVGQQRRAAQ